MKGEETSRQQPEKPAPQVAANNSLKGSLRDRFSPDAIFSVGLNGESERSSLRRCLDVRDCRSFQIGDALERSPV